MERDTKRVVLICAAMITTVIATPAAASDPKNYAGSECVNWSGGTPGYYYSGITNTNASSDMYVDCPAVNDSITSSLAGAWVMVIDKNDAESVRCQLCTRAMIDASSAIYGTCSSYQYSGDSYYGTDAKKLSFGSLSHYSDYEYHYLSCRVPDSDVGDSRIQSYSVDET